MESANINKIAIFRALNLGDLLCIIPVARALRSAFKDASITLIGLPWQEQFVKRFNKYFDKFISFPGWPGLPEQKFDEDQVVAFLQKIKQQHFDLVLQMQGNGSITNSMCMLWGARIVTGLRLENDYCPDKTLFPFSEDDENEILRFLKLTAALGIAAESVDLEFPITREDETHFKSIAETLQLPFENYVCIHPGARDKRRRWNPRHFAFIGDHLAKRGYRVVLTGADEERKLLEEVSSQMHHSCINPVSQLNEFTLGDLACMIRGASLLVSNDTGVSHIASALKTPSVIIFSPFSNIQRWAPLNRSLHLAITPESAGNTEYVLHCVLDQLEKFSSHKSTLLFD